MKHKHFVCWAVFAQGCAWTSSVLVDDASTADAGADTGSSSADASSDAGLLDGPRAGWFSTGQNASLMLSGVDFNNTGGASQFNHPSGIASDGTRFLLCDRFNNRVLVWKTLPSAWNAPPDFVLGQSTLTSNNPSSTKSGLNWPGNVSVGSNGVVAVADTENDRILIWNQFPTTNGEAASISISLPALTAQGSPQRYEWPWGIWTDGKRLAAVATHGGALLFWSALPTKDDAKPDYTIALPEFGTLRNISTDGATFFAVGDHNAHNMTKESGTFVWNAFPTKADQRFDWFYDEWIKGTKLSDGKFIAGGLSAIYVWNKMPTGATAKPDITLRPPYYSNGDGPDIVTAGNRIWVNNYNGNDVLVYDGVPASASTTPSFAVGSSSVSSNSLENIHYIQNPVLATDGTRLIATSDFDRTLWLWKTMPTKSGLAPDVKVSLLQADVAPWDNALSEGRFVAGGKQSVAIWDALPLNGEQPTRVLRNKIGSVTLNNVKGVALDASYLYVADEPDMLYVWKGLPATNDEPWLKMKLPGVPANHAHSDGTYLSVTIQGGTQGGGYIYRVADFANKSNPQPIKTILASQAFPLNLAAETITFGGAVAITNTNNNAVYVWKSLEEAGDASKATILGQMSTSTADPGNGPNQLFLPASLAAYDNQLWVGEIKFSSRIVQFVY